MPIPSTEETHPSWDKEEEEESDMQNYNYKLTGNQCHIQTRNLKNATASPKKVVSFERHATQHQYDRVYDAEGDMRSREDVMDDTDNDTLAAAAQLQEEAQRNARNPRDRSSRQQIHSAGPSQPVGSTSRSPSRQDPAVSFRTTRSRSPPKHNVTTARPSGVGSNRSQTTNGPAKPTPRRAQSAFISIDPIPAENLTPQEKKDNELDANVMARLASIRSHIKKLCDDHLAFGIKRRTLNSWKQWVKEQETADGQKFLNFSRAVAEGGGGNETWRQIVSDGQCRVGLAYGIIHRALVRHVFGSLLFGAPQDLMENLDKMQIQQEDEDGFYREEKRAEYITSYELLHRVNLNTTQERKQATLRLALQIVEILRPLLRLRTLDNEEYNHLTQKLIIIVSAAADLATLMRKSGNTVLYQFGNVFKDQVVDTSIMDILNLEEMNEEQKVGGIPGAHEALTRILCAQPFYAYRMGGGVMAERILEREEQQVDMSVAPELRHLPRNQYRGRLITAQDGYRHKFLAKAVFVARWGQAGERSVRLEEALQTLQDDACAQQ